MTDSTVIGYVVIGDDELKGGGVRVEVYTHRADAEEIRVELADLALADDQPAIYRVYALIPASQECK